MTKQTIITFLQFNILQYSISTPTAFVRLFLMVFLDHKMYKNIEFSAFFIFLDQSKNWTRLRLTTYEGNFVTKHTFLLLFLAENCFTTIKVVFVRPGLVFWKKACSQVYSPSFTQENALNVTTNPQSLRSIRKEK